VHIRFAKKARGERGGVLKRAGGEGTVRRKLPRAPPIRGEGGTGQKEETIRQEACCVTENAIYSGGREEEEEKEDS